MSKDIDILTDAMMDIWVDAISNGGNMNGAHSAAQALDVSRRFTWVQIGTSLNQTALGTSWATLRVQKSL